MSVVLEQKIQHPRSKLLQPASEGSRPNPFQSIVQNIFYAADVEVNGTRPWDIQVHDSRFYRRVFSSGSLGLGESYMDGWWDCRALDEFFFRILRTSQRGDFPYRLFHLFSELRGRLINLQAGSRAFQVGRAHYDVGDDLYKRMLDKRMVYSCGYWRHADNLDAAQEAKLDLVCRKLGLAPGMTVLDIGCGWGSFLQYAAERYQVRGYGVTVSRNQYIRAKDLCRTLPVEIRYQDYRELKGQFDRIVSIGMFEHVGHKNYPEYMRVARRCLKNGGLFLLHTIAGNRSQFGCDPWIDKYIFPNAQLPSMKQISSAVEGLFFMEDCHNLSVDYDRTLMSWRNNFEAAWPKLASTYSRRFYRMWRYYLLSCAAAFRSRNEQVWQIVLSASGVLGGYRSSR